MKTRDSRTNCFFAAICTVLIVAGLFLNPAMAQDNSSVKILYLTGLNDNAAITLTNSEDAEDLATVKAYNANGLPVGTIFRTLSPGQTETIEAQELPDSIRSVTVEYNGNLSCSAIVNGQNISAIDKPLTQFDFPAENTSAVVILNPNDSQADVDVIALDKDGIEIERSTVSGLYPMESREVVLKDVFGTDTWDEISFVGVASKDRIVAQPKISLLNKALASRRSSSLPKTSTGFYYPTGSKSFYIFPCGKWLGRDSANGGCYFSGSYHIGVDIKATLDSSVYPISDGVVKRISTSGWGTGNVAAIIEHTLSDNSKFLALYGHIKISLKEGDKVTGGVSFAKIGYWSNGIHLHFGVHPSTSISGNLGALPNSSWDSTNGFVDPIKWIETKSPKGGSSPALGSVSGKLHETTANGPALSGATVTCGGKSTTTDSKGAFSMSGISTGWQNLKFSKTGYQSYEKGVYITAGQTANAGDVYLIKNPGTDQAAFAGENYPDNTSVTGGTSFTKEWKIKNTGGTTWTSAYKLRLYKFTGGRLSTITEKAVSGTVSPNTIYSFQVPMKAPAAQSSDKTYREEWNLVGPSGIIPVSGSQIVWVQIKVPGGGTGGGSDKATFVSENYPDNTSVNGNSSFTKEWTLKNTGTTTWNPGYKLRYSSDSGMRLSSVNEITISGTVAPNASYTFSVPMKAPAAQSVEVAYREEWNFVNASGSIINVNASPVVWVQIKVPAGTPQPPQPGCTIKITNPSPGEEWDTDEEYHKIQWDTDNCSCKHVKIEFSLDSGNTWQVVPDSDSTTDDGSKKWYMGQDTRLCKDTDKAKIRITCVEHPEYFGVSEKFKIDHKKGYPNCD